MDDFKGVEVSETGEEAVEDAGDLFVGQGRPVPRCIVEEGLEVDGQEWEYEGEFSAGEGECVYQGDDISVFGFGEDASFAERIVGRGALGRDGDFESVRSFGWIVGFVDC